MSTLKIIEGQVQEIPFPVWHQVCDAFFQDKDSNSAYNLIKDWHKQSIIQILQSEIERKRGMNKDEDKIDVPRGSNIGEYRFVEKLKREGFNEALEEDITHLTNLIDNLK